MKYQDIQEEAIQNIESYYGKITMDGGYDFDHVGTLESLSMYSALKFKSGELDAKGRRKHFIPVVKKTCDNATKMIDLDVANIGFITDIDEQYDMTWLASAEFRIWAKEINFGSFLNDVAQLYPLYGTVVIKKSKDGWDVVNLHNLILDTTVRSISDSTYVYEKIVMSDVDVEEMNWDEKKGLLKSGAKKFIVFEMYHKTGKGYDRTIIGKEYDEDDSDYKKELDGCIELHSDTVTKLPYKDLHWEKVFGRWLGFGLGEYMIGAQISENEAENMERRGLYFTSLHLLKTNDDSIGSNIYSDYEDGDILKTNKDISSLDVSERNLMAFKMLRDRWAGVISSSAFLFDMNSQVSSTTPAAMMSMMLQIQQSYFQMKREQFAFFVKDIIKEELIERFKKTKKGNHKLLITRTMKGAERFIETLAGVVFDSEVMKKMKKGEYFPDNYDVAKASFIEQKKKKGLSLEIPSGYYDLLSNSMEIEIVGESYNETQAIQAIQIIMQLASTQPGIFKDPLLRSMVLSMAELSKVPPRIINAIQDSAEQQPQMMQQNMMQEQMMQPKRGGSIAVPEPNVIPSTSNPSI